MFEPNLDRPKTEDDVIELTDEVMEIENVRVSKPMHDVSESEQEREKRERLERYQPPKDWKDKKAA